MVVTPVTYLCIVKNFFRSWVLMRNRGCREAMAPLGRQSMNIKAPSNTRDQQPLKVNPFFNYISILHSIFHQLQWEFLSILSECQYDNPEFSDCDPFTLKKTRVKNLIRGGASCGPAHVNETEDCSQEDFPEGNHHSQQRPNNEMRVKTPIATLPVFLFLWRHFLFLQNILWNTFLLKHQNPLHSLQNHFIY